MATEKKESKRRPLSRDRVLDAALRLADKQGVEALSMRSLGRALGVEAMSLYRYVKNKDELLDGIVDRVVSKIEVPPAGSEWRAAMRGRARSARRAFVRHPWAAALFEARLEHQTPVRLGYANAVLGLLREGGFSVSAAYRAFLLVDSYLYGFIMQETSWRVEDGDLSRAAQESAVLMISEAYPHLAEVMAYTSSANAEAPISLDTEFDHGLERVLDALERIRHDG